MFRGGTWESNSDSYIVIFSQLIHFFSSKQKFISKILLSTSFILSPQIFFKNSLNLFLPSKFVKHPNDQIKHQPITSIKHYSKLLSNPFSIEYINWHFNNFKKDWTKWGKFAYESIKSQFFMRNSCDSGRNSFTSFFIVSTVFSLEEISWGREEVHDSMTKEISKIFSPKWITAHLEINAGLQTSVSRVSNNSLVLGRIMTLSLLGSGKNLQSSRAGFIHSTQIALIGPSNLIQLISFVLSSLLFLKADVKIPSLQP